MHSEANMDFSDQESLVTIKKHKKSFTKTFIDKPPFILNCLLVICYKVQLLWTPSNPYFIIEDQSYYHERLKRADLLTALCFNHTSGRTGDCPDDQLTEEEKPQA